MGVKQTKIEGSYLPETPLTTRVQRIYQQNVMDPRSPNVNVMRTPITLDRTNEGDNALGLLRKRLRGFVHSMSDPRSPSTHLNRTPLIFDKSIDKTLDLDDTFADLFVESNDIAAKEPFVQTDTQIQTNNIEMQVDDNDAATERNRSIEKREETEEERVTAPNSPVETDLPYLEAVFIDEEATMLCPAVLRKTPIALQQQLDPRSPTYGVDRTPIIFSDDDEAGEDAFLENVLATLSLDLSNTSSIFSFDRPILTANDMDDAESPRLKSQIGMKPANKHLDRVRTGKRRFAQQKLTRQHRQRIYEDTENISTLTTPKTKTPTRVVEEKRTPLSCVKNRANLRSRSVEASTKSLKARLPFTSYDDSFSIQNSSE